MSVPAPMYPFPYQHQHPHHQTMGVTQPMPLPPQTTWHSPVPMDPEQANYYNGNAHGNHHHHMSSPVPTLIPMENSIGYRHQYMDAHGAHKEPHNVAYHHNHNHHMQCKFKSGFCGQYSENNDRLSKLSN